MSAKYSLRNLAISNGDHNFCQIQAADIENKKSESKIGTLTAELEETKQSLQRAWEENNLMAYRIKSLREELDQTRKGIQKLKVIEFQKKRVDPDIEDIKFVENPTNVKTKTQHDEDKDFEKKRYVQFASPPSLAQVIINRDEFVERSSPPKKTKRKPLAPLLGWLFSKKKDIQESESS